MTDAVKEVKVKEIQDLQKAASKALTRALQEKVDKKEARAATQPILDKADKAIKDVAKEKNLRLCIRF